MIEVFKITHNIYSPEVSLNVIRNHTLEVVNISYLITHFTMMHGNSPFRLV